LIGLRALERLGRRLGRPWRRRRAKIDISSLLEWASRAGYAARGFVYLSIGALAALAALEFARTPAGSQGAVAWLADWPFGQVWIGAVAVGLICFSLWRALQSIFDADRQGSDLKALASRAGQAVSGIVYGTLAWSLLEVLDELEDIGEADENQSARSMTADIMELPLGHWLVILTGVFILGVAAANLIQAARRDFCRGLACPDAARPLAVWTGRLGYGARGLAFLPLGFFIIKAGWTFRSSEARNLGGALQAIEAQPLGTPILVGAGLGLMAFGLYALLEALWRRIEAPEAG
jgi:hypothetical protein